MREINESLALSKNAISLVNDAASVRRNKMKSSSNELLFRFNDIVRKACPTLRFRAESHHDDLMAGCEYAIVIDYSYVIDASAVLPSSNRSPGVRLMVELINLDRPLRRTIDVDHMELFQYLGLLDE
jgi:hypothetical protein